MYESVDLCSRLLERLLFSRGELRVNSSRLDATEVSLASRQFGNTINLVVFFLERSSVKKLLQRLASSRTI